MNRLDEPVFIAGSKPLLNEFGIHHRLESCVSYKIVKIKLETSLLQAEDALKTIKSTLILFPLLGITNLLFFVNPKDNGVASNFYVVFNATMQSSQVS